MVGPDGVSRRRFLAGTAAAVAAGAVALEGLVLEPRRLAVTRHTLDTGSVGGGGLRLAVLADLHLKSLGGFHAELAAAVADAGPDAVVLLGDAIDRDDALPILADFLDLLPREPECFAILGNWEYWSGVDLGALRRTYADAGTRLLVDEAVRIGPRKVLVGLDDYLAGRPDPGAVPRDGGDEVILLSHCPAYRDEIPPATGDRLRAVISGHTHGGQIAVGGWAPFRPPGSGPYVSGWYREGGPDLFVSRGLGTSVVPLRLGAVPELALIDWGSRA